MGIAVCLGRFGYTQKAYKILQYLGADYLKVMPKLLGAEQRIIADLIKRAHHFGDRVVVPPVEDPRLIGEPWLSAADLVQGDAVQPPAQNPDYDPSAALH